MSPDRANLPKFKTNQEVSKLLQEMANLLEQQHANPFRVAAYHQAAETINQLDISVNEIVANKGFEGLLALPHIGEGIGRSIYEYVATERMSRLEDLRGESHPEILFQSVPGIGPRLAERIHHELHINTLETLEQAVHNGKLAALPGIGPRKIAAIEASLEKILGKPNIRALSHGKMPGIETLLKIDNEYRHAVAANLLPKISPKRFNPKNEPWLPIMHKSKDHWHFTVLFSNTARAHKLKKTDDWVIIYFYDEFHNEGQNTVVTETHGPLINRRVVRGHELECQAYYQEQS
jgi:putative hydrolase